MPSLGYTYDDHLPADFSDRSLRADVLAGLTAPAKWLPPKWFYDKVGSELFEEITRLPEYYPTRSEAAILTAHAAEMVGGRPRTADRARLGLVGEDPAAAGRDERRPCRTAAYVALDVSEDALRSACAGLVALLPAARGGVRCGRISPANWTCCRPAADRTVAFLGQHDRQLRAGRARRVPARSLRAGLSPGDHFLLGADLVKSADLLVPAYDDAAGVTAAFNLNVLDVLNHRLAADFDRAAFDHVAVWDAATTNGSRCGCGPTGTSLVHMPDLDLRVAIARGEHIRTEISAKFRRGGPDRRTRRRGISSSAAGGPTSRAGSRCPCGVWPEAETRVPGLRLRPESWAGPQARARARASGRPARRCSTAPRGRAAVSPGCRRGRRTGAHGVRHLLDLLLGVAEQHRRIFLVEQRVLHAGVAGGHRPLEDHDVLGLPHLQHRHAGDRGGRDPPPRPGSPCRSRRSPAPRRCRRVRLGSRPSPARCRTAPWPRPAARSYGRAAGRRPGGPRTGPACRGAGTVR